MELKIKLNELEAIMNSESSPICRLCLSYEAFEYVSLDAHESMSLVKMIINCTGIQVRANNEFTNEICTVCRNDVIKLNELRERFLASDKILRDLHKKRNELHCQLFSATLSTEKDNFDGEIENDDTEQQGVFIQIENNTGISQDEHEVKLTTSSDIEAHVPELDKIVNADSQNKEYLLTNNQEDAVQQLVCCGCNPSPEFTSRNELISHCDKQHEKYRVTDGSIRPFECNICFQRFLTQSLLKHHQARPYRKRPYICESCGSAYFTNSALKRHEKICTVVEKNYTCEECGKRFRQIITLKNHRRLHQAEKTFACPVCSKTFKQKFEITIHMITHTGEQPYPCDQCPARFKRKQALKNHQHRHLNPRPFKCQLCDEWFNNPTARKFHRLTVHEGLDPFRCEQCGVSYGRRLRLTQHMRKVHGQLNT